MKKTGFLYDILGRAGMKCAHQICFQVFAYCEPHINADERRRRVHPRFVKAVFPEKNSGKLLVGYLKITECRRLRIAGQFIAGNGLFLYVSPGQKMDKKNRVFANPASQLKGLSS